MQIDWWTLGLQTVNVLILIWILAHFLFRPLTAILKERQEKASRLLEDAEANKAAAEAERKKAEAETARIAASRNEALQDAAGAAEKQKASILAEARAEADEIREAAKADVERARKNETVAVADRASRLAVDIAEKVLARLPEGVRDSAFLDGLADGLASLPEATRADIGANGIPVRVKAAHALTDGEKRDCLKTLTDVLGRPVEITVETDPDLIAGLEIETPHAVVSNSFRADLDRITAELTRHDKAEK